MEMMPVNRAGGSESGGPACTQRRCRFSSTTASG